MRPRGLLPSVVVAVALAAGGTPAATAAPLTAAAPVSVASAALVSADWVGKAPTRKRMSTADRDALKRTVDEQVAALNGTAPGVWVGVWDPQRGWAIVSSGNAQVGGTIARKIDHNRIGSVTKTFVATEILKLVDAGTLKLRDTIGDLLPDVAKKYPYASGVTVRQLLGMRSGLVDYTDVAGVMKSAYENPERRWTTRQLIDVALSSTSTLASQAAYCNTNYLLLGEIAEAVTGRSINTLVNANARQLGLRQTRLPRPGNSTMPKPYSRGYTYEPGILSLAPAGVSVTPGDEQTDDVTQWGQAAGAMYSTVADMGRWAATGLGTDQLSTRLARQRLASRPINDGLISYGLGVDDFGAGWIGHDGQAIGWEDRVAYNPSTGAVAVVMVNETGSLGNVLPVLGDYFPDIAS
jgi:D-alanyl-D-alanine carboxypeptidase